MHEYKSPCPGGYHASVFDFLGARKPLSAANNLGYAFWQKEKIRWNNGKQKPCLLEYGDRYEMTPLGNSFIHVPTRMEIIDDLKSSGFIIEADVLRKNIANESNQVRDFSDECRFWVARKDNKT